MLKWYFEKKCIREVTTFNVFIYSVVLRGLIIILTFYLVVFTAKSRKTHRKNGPFLACPELPDLMCACAFATKTMAVCLFRDTKIANFGGLFFPIVHLFRLRSNGFWFIFVD